MRGISKGVCLGLLLLTAPVIAQQPQEPGMGKGGWAWGAAAWAWVAPGPA